MPRRALEMRAEKQPMMRECGEIHGFKIHNTPNSPYTTSFIPLSATHQHLVKRNLKYVKGSNSHTFTLASFSCSRGGTHTALTDTVQSRHTPGQPRV